MAEISNLNRVSSVPGIFTLWPFTDRQIFQLLTVWYIYLLALMVYDSKFFLVSISLFILILNKWKQEERRGKSVKNAMVLKNLDRKWSAWNLN